MACTIAKYINYVLVLKLQTLQTVFTCTGCNISVTIFLHHNIIYYNPDNATLVHTSLQILKLIGFRFTEYF